jgi:hypothetical protein
LSRIYDWFQDDFGRTEKGVIQHIVGYAENPLAEALRTFSGRIDYDYDWRLNDL